MQTRLCELLEIKHPIIQGAMGPNDTTDLAIAVCRAGALGTISSSDVTTAYETTRQHIQKVKEQTDSPFAVNQVIKGPGAADRIRAVIDERKADPEVRRRLRVVITSGGDPKVFSGILKESGVLHLQVVPTVYHAKKAVAAGCDAIIAEGYESGGHVAYEPVHTMVLVPAAIEATGLPVIAAGGISDGRGLAASLALGAIGVQMATRFYLSKEANFARPEIQTALLAAKETDTMIVPGVYGLNRHWRNPYALRLKEMVDAGIGEEELHHVKMDGDVYRAKGDTERASVPIGMVVGRITETRSVREIIEGTVAEAEQILRSLVDGSR